MRIQKIVALLKGENVQDEKSDLIAKLIYHSLRINACKKLKMDYEKLKLPTKALLGSSYWMIPHITGLIFDLNVNIEKHLHAMTPLARKFIELNNLTTELKVNEIIPFGTNDLKRGYVELGSINNRNYFIILNQGIIITDESEDYVIHISESYPVIPKGYSILFN